MQFVFHRITHYHITYWKLKGTNVPRASIDHLFSSTFNQESQITAKLWFNIVLTLGSWALAPLMETLGFLWSGHLHGSPASAIKSPKMPAFLQSAGIFSKDCQKTKFVNVYLFIYHGNHTLLCSCQKNIHYDMDTVVENPILIADSPCRCRCRCRNQAWCLRWGCMEE